VADFCRRELPVFHRQVARRYSPFLAQSVSKTAWSRPLRLHLSAGAVLLLLAITLPLMWLTYKQSTNSAVVAAREQMSSLSRRVVDRYHAVFSAGFSAISISTASEALLTEPPANMPGKTDFLVQALLSSPHIDGLYVGYGSGSFIQAVNVARNRKWVTALAAPLNTAIAVRSIETGIAGDMRSSWTFRSNAGQILERRETDRVSYDPRIRPWYRGALGKRGAITVGPYVTATTASLALTIASPMQRDAKVIIGADVLLETLSDLLSNEAVSPHAVGMVFDSLDRLIVHSDPVIMAGVLTQLRDTHFDSKAAALDDAVTLKIQQLIRDGRGDGPAVFENVGAPYLADFSSVSFSPLVGGNRIVIAAPLSDFTEASTALLRKFLLVSSLLLLAGISIALLASRLISRSITALTSEASEFENLDFAQAPALRSHITEINTLAAALHSARDAIGTFAQYVPREIVRQIIKAGQAEAGGVRQDVTVIFSDIKDFTTISERHPPEEVTTMLSAYFQILNDIVVRHSGVIVQYLGDSIYAMWNAPTPDPDHVVNACHCALELLAEINVFNSRSVLEGRPELVTRIGLHTGPAVVGSVGARDRLQYTAMGDTVNVASRLEGMNKLFGTTILVSDAIVRQAEKVFDFRNLGHARAKGRDEEINLSELIGLSLAVRKPDSVSER
jgi:adenylate cyclase